MSGFARFGAFRTLQKILPDLFISVTGFSSSFNTGGKINHFNSLKKITDI
jgi:hypothetical protein